MINFIKQRPVHSKMFKKLCESLDKEHWLSRGRVLNRVFQLNELQIYFEQNDKPNFSKCFEHKKWLQSLAYLADIFGHTNLLNKKLQGSNENILTSNDKILRFKKE
ncbi:Zinc finger BED domain-containing protein 5 [Trichinella spiralis]|uniref:Zinc finger BED domain-containing protein 5 n=1 Tax=Trichinella spiralis TaxID=6334 RepID=A0A0V1AQQ8_TRISP|nr:Zinc finger BED domain-containing protein 5 [Trichinella spiralis]